jgi:hypothetical protein
MVEFNCSGLTANCDDQEECSRSKNWKNVGKTVAYVRTVGRS